VNAEKMAAHLRVERYGDFVLTAAVRPGLELPVVPREAFRLDVYRDPAVRLRVPVLAASVSREKLFDLFLDLLSPLGETVDVVLETSHQSRGDSHFDLVREQIDLPILKSHFLEFEDLLLNDGCAGVAVLSAVAPIEVQFDEHKLLIVYAHDLEPFERVLRQSGVSRDDALKLITEGEHLHNTDPTYAEQFEQLCCRVGVAEPAERVSW
jgi:hypothetical protein